MHRLANLLSSILICAIVLCSCAPSKAPTTVPVNVTIKIKDPALQKIASITERMTFVVSGVFLPGKHKVRGLNIDVKENTKFTLNADLPIGGQTQISTSSATGVLTTDQSLVINNVPAPLQIKLNHGVMSADVDLARTLLEFVINCLQGVTAGVDAAASATAPGSELASMLGEVEVTSATMILKDGAKIAEPNFKATIGPKSELKIHNLKIDRNLDYQGSFSTYLELPTMDVTDEKHARHTQAVHSKVFASFDCRKSGQQIQLVLRKERGTCSVESGGVKVSDSTGSIDLTSFKMKLEKFEIKRTVGEADSEVTLQGHLNAAGRCNLKRSEGSVTATIYANDAAVTFVDDKGRINYNFASNVQRADDVVIKSARKNATLELKLKEAQFDSFSLTRQDGIALTFSQGLCRPDSLALTANKRSLMVNFGKGTALKLSPELTESKQLGSRNFTMAINSAKIRVTGGAVPIECDDVKGTINISTGNEISADGKFTLNVASKNNIVDSARAKIKELDVHVENNQATVDIIGCRLFIPEAELQKSLQTHLPQKKVFPVNKTVLEGRRWRYRNCVLKQVTVTNPHIKQVKVLPGSKFQFQGDSNVLAEGTIERFKLRLFNKDERWSTFPWKASGEVAGAGQVDLKFVPGATLNDSVLNYQATFKMQVPEKLNVDWSQLSGDVLGKAERTLMESVVKNADHFVPADGMPLKFSGQIKPFNRQVKNAARVTVRKFQMDTSAGGVAVNIDARLQN